MAAHLAGFSDIAAHAPPEEEGLGEGIGAVEGRNADGKDDVEGCGGTEIDDTDETRYSGQNVNRVDRNRSFSIHLVARASEIRERTLGDAWT